MSVFQQERSFDLCEYGFIIFPYKTAEYHKTREWKLEAYGDVLGSIPSNF